MRSTTRTSVPPRRAAVQKSVTAIGETPEPQDRRFDEEPPVLPSQKSVESVSTAASAPQYQSAYEEEPPIETMAAPQPDNDVVEDYIYTPRSARRKAAGPQPEPERQTSRPASPAPAAKGAPAVPPRGGRGGRNNPPGKPRKLSTPVLVLSIVLSVLVLVFGSITVYGYSQLSLMRYQPPVGTVDPGLDDDGGEGGDDQPALDNVPPPQTAAPIDQGKGVYNIILFGLDTRDPDQFTGRSDAIMLVTLNTKAKTIKMTSFMRDILVDIPEHGRNRLNTAFMYGGPDLALQCLRQNFGVQADWYAVINFWCLADVIDALGGVEVDLTAAEVKDMNKSIKEMNRLTTVDKRVPNVVRSGKRQLNGLQAVAYMRIRHVGQGDFQRTQRQRVVMGKLTGCLSDMTLPQAISLINTIPRYVRTNMTQPQMLDMASKVLSLRGADVREFRVPADDAYRLGSYNGMKGVILPDFDKCAEGLRQFLLTE